MRRGANLLRLKTQERLHQLVRCDRHADAHSDAAAFGRGRDENRVWQRPAQRQTHVIGDVVVRPPIDDGEHEHRAVAVGAVIDRADGSAPAVGADAVERGHVRNPGAAHVRIGEIVPSPVRRDREVDRDVLAHARVVLADYDNAPFSVCFPDRPHVEDTERDLAEGVVFLPVAYGMLEVFSKTRGVRRRLGERRVGADAGRGTDAVLQQPVNQDHVRPAQLLTTGDGLLDIGAVVDQQLEIELRDVAAGRAGAGGVVQHRLERVGEAAIEAFDHVEHMLAVGHVAGARMRQDGIALDIGQRKWGAQLGQQRGK